MSKRNIDLTRELYARWNSGERPDPAEYCDPATGRSSGINFDRPMAWVSVFGEEHQVKSLRIYLDVEQALTDVGLAS